MFWVNRVALLVLENANGLTFLGGAGWCYLGLVAFSPRLANVVAGLVVMAIGLVPYVLRRKRSR